MINYLIRCGEYQKIPFNLFNLNYHFEKNNICNWCKASVYQTCANAIGIAKTLSCAYHPYRSTL